MSSRALEGLLVVEFSQLIAGPHAALLLATHGAEVVKIEPPNGDVSRRMGPSLPNDLSAMYVSCNRGKRTIAVDLTNESDLAGVIQLARTADIFITNQDSNSLSRFELDWPSLAATNPRLVYAEVSAFGSGGPHGTDGLAQAASGLASLTGPADGEAFRTGASVVDVSAGVWLAFGIMIALEDRRRTGLGALVRTSLLDVALGLAMNQVAMFSVDPSRIQRLGNHSMTTCTPMFQASDGRFSVTLMHAEHWRRFCTALNQPELIEDPRFRDDDLRRRSQSEIEIALNPMLSGEPRATWVDRLRAFRIPAAPEHTLAEVLSDRELHTRGILQNQSVPPGELVTLVGSPVIIEPLRLAPELRPVRT